MNAVFRYIVPIFVGLGLACASAPEVRSDQLELEVKARAKLELMQEKDPNLAEVLSNSAGYAVFPTIGEGGFIVGALSGVGVLFDPEGNVLGYCETRGGSVGAQIGGQRFSQLMIFQHERALATFQQNDFEFSSDASAVAADKGASVRMAFSNGVATVVDDEDGLMAEASIGGQRYRYYDRPPTAPADW